MSKRILWIFNHTTLRKWEVPLLIEMGYEVFCPKHYGVDFGDLSTTTTTEFDYTLTIPSEVLEILNKTNFYEKLPNDILGILNKYFDIAFCLVGLEPLKSLLEGYKGEIVVQCFGLAGNLSFANVMDIVGGRSMLQLINRCGSRFWFSAAYDNLIDIEPDIIKRRSIYMPISFHMKNHLSWTGGERKILFVSPKIKTSPYYRKVYEDFKHNFKSIPYVISGAQLVPVTDDKNVTGFLPKEEYEYNMQHLSAMFYHSQEPRHIHYHPLEAVNIGMPLVFMAGGMLDNLGGTNLPGRCKTVKEAKAKLKRLIRGDRRLQKKIIESQRILLKKVSNEYCKPFWYDAMKKIDGARPETTQRDKKIAVILPAKYVGGVLDYALRFTQAIEQCASKNNDKLSIVFAYPDKMNMPEYALRVLREKNIAIRTFDAIYRDADWTLNEHIHAGIEPIQDSLYKRDYLELYDGMNDFGDCDYAFVMSDACVDAKPFFLKIPYSIVVHDVIQKYVADVITREAQEAKEANMFKADYVLTTSLPTMEDVMQIGISKERIKLTPPLFSIDTHLNHNGKETFFLWSTNVNGHKNHINAIRALEKYYSIGGKLDVIITGFNTELLNPKNKLYKEYEGNEYLKTVRTTFLLCPQVLNHVRFNGNMQKSAYLKTLSKARFVFCPGYGDNGNFSVIDAAAVGTAALSSDYPAARYMANYCGVMMNYFDPFSEEDIARKLLDMENNYAKYTAQLPSAQELYRYDYKMIADQLYTMIREIIRL